MGKSYPFVRIHPSLPHNPTPMHLVLLRVKRLSAFESELRKCNDSTILVIPSVGVHIAWLSVFGAGCTLGTRMGCGR